jgi:Domain of unknown function (DUF4412)
MTRTLFALLLLLASPSFADTLLTIKSRVEGLNMPGQSPESTARVWLAGDKLRRDDGDTSTILRLDRNKLYILDHAGKTYSELPLPVDLQKLAGLPKDALPKSDVQVTSTNETRKVKNWNARKVKVAVTSAAGLKLDTTMWVSRDVPSYAAFNKMLASMAALQPAGTELSRKLEQIEGFPVLQETQAEINGSRFTAREELVSVETKDAPAGAYEPPAGYKVQPFGGIPR